MARQKAIVRKLKLQRRYAVDEIRLREMNREAHARAAVIRPHPGSKKSIEQVNFERRVEDLMGVLPDELPSELNKRRRVFLGLDSDASQQTPRDLVMYRMNRMADHAECLFRAGNRAMYLIRTETGYWYFLYREKGKFYEKSVKYKSKAMAMDKYERNDVSWIAFFRDTTGD